MPNRVQSSIPLKLQTRPECEDQGVVLHGKEFALVFDLPETVQFAVQVISCMKIGKMGTLALGV